MQQAKERSPAAALCRALEDVASLFVWDMPVLNSPVKIGSDKTEKLGNSVVVVTKLPSDWANMCKYMGFGAVRRKLTTMEVMDSLTNKKVKDFYCGACKVGLHILDIREEGGKERMGVLKLINIALKETSGGVLTMPSLCTPFQGQIFFHLRDKNSRKDISLHDQNQEGYKKF